MNFSDQMFWSCQFRFRCAQIMHDYVDHIISATVCFATMMVEATHCARAQRLPSTDLYISYYI